MTKKDKYVIPDTLILKGKTYKFHGVFDEVFLQDKTEKMRNTQYETVNLTEIREKQNVYSGKTNINKLIDMSVIDVYALYLSTNTKKQMACKA